jgi:G2/mitotic-specific cyclin 3/4
MENSYRYRTTTNESADVLKHKVPARTSQLPTANPPTRVALGDVSSNITTRNSRIALQKPAQRVQVYTESSSAINDENAVPTAKILHTRSTDENVKRKPLADINIKQSVQDIEEEEVEDDEDVTAYLQEEESSMIEEDDSDEIPQGLMPKLSSQIHKELTVIYRKFYSESLDEEDEDSYDVSMVAEYSPEIFNYIHSLEMKMRPNPRYMKFQTELKWNMRSILIDWLIQVHSRFNLLPETLFLTVNYIDRFLSKRKVSLSRFQLVGAVALFIAAKYEEINCPSVQEIAYMVDHAYTVEDILKAERFMIDVLEFEMGWPGPMSFLRRASKADNYDFETRTLAKYFLEITVMDYRFVASPPSWLAAGAHYLSRLLLNRGDWTEAHVYYSGYTADQLRPLAQTLLEACRSPEEHHKSIYEKYQERRFRRSSLFVQEWFKIAEERSE